MGSEAESGAGGQGCRSWTNRAEQLCPSHRHTKVLGETRPSLRPFHLHLIRVYRYHATMGNIQETTRSSHIFSTSLCISQCRTTVWIYVKYYVYFPHMQNRTNFSYPNPESHKPIQWGAEIFCSAGQCCDFYTNTERIWTRPDL